MRNKRKINISKPQYAMVEDITFAQVDTWFGNTRKDLRMDIIYPKDSTKTYPCILWICGGAWALMNKAVHMPYLAKLAQSGFVVASAEYRTSNEVQFPHQLEDVKAAIRYLRANSKRYNIASDKIGVSGESAGGYLASMAALVNDSKYEVGDNLQYSSEVMAACPWYPPTDFARMSLANNGNYGGAPESLLLGKDVTLYPDEAKAICPVTYVHKDAPPFFIIHGNGDTLVPFSQSELLYEALIKNGADARLLELEGANHGDIDFFQDEIWDEMASFFKEIFA